MKQLINNRLPSSTHKGTHHGTPRILFPFVGDTVGGSHQSAALLISALYALNMQPLVLIHRYGPLRKFFVDRSIQTLTFSSLPVWEKKSSTIGGLIYFIFVTLKLLPALKKLKVDLVHVNDGRMAISWSLATRIFRLPFVVHQRTLLSKSRLTEIALSRASVIVAISEHTRRSLPNSFLPKIIIIQNPFNANIAADRHETRNETAKLFSLDPLAPILVFAANISYQKRPLVALGVMSILRKKGIKATLLVSGRFDDVAHAELQCFISSNGLEESVRVLGYREDISKILAVSDLLLAPAVGEGHGRVLIESMLVGTPVIASNSGGHSEIIRHLYNGYLVTPDSADEMATGVTELLANEPLRKGISKRARTDAYSRFVSNKSTQEIAKLYLELIEKQCKKVL